MVGGEAAGTLDDGGEAIFDFSPTKVLLEPVTGALDDGAFACGGDELWNVDLPEENVDFPEEKDGADLIGAGAEYDRLGDGELNDRDDPEEKLLPPPDEKLLWPPPPPPLAKLIKQKNINNRLTYLIFPPTWSGVDGK